MWTPPCRMPTKIGRRPSPLDSWRELLDASRNGRTVNWRWQLSERMAVETLRRLADRLNRPPQRAWVEWENGQVRIIPSQDGQRLDIAATLDSWRQRLAEGRWRTLPLVVRKERPEVTTEDVAAIDGVVGEATTFFKAWERNRSHNIRLAAQRLDHVFIPPARRFPSPNSSSANAPSWLSHCPCVGAGALHPRFRGRRLSSFRDALQRPR
jgi:vancomycin resistance protein YoaR